MTFVQTNQLTNTTVANSTLTMLFWWSSTKIGVSYYRN